jgi:hypothetical protein
MIPRALEKGTLLLLLLFFGDMEEGEEAAAILFMALVVSPFWCIGFVYGAAADRVRDPFFLLQYLEDWLSLLFFET